MQKIDLFIFDLDGTLIDSKRDIALSVHHTMKILGLSPISDEMIASYVGNGVTPLIRKSVGENPKLNVDEAIRIFMAHYEEHCLDSTRPFPDIPEVLDHFKDKIKIVATNKPQGFSEKILDGLGLTTHFQGIFGGDTHFPKKPDPAVIHHLLKTFQAEVAKSVIIGDSRIDIETGRNARILTCGVTWGFRPGEELTGSDFLVDRPEDLIRIFQ